MLELFVHTMEVTLVCLVTLLAYKIHFLYSLEYEAAPNRNVAENTSSRFLHGNVTQNAEYDKKMKALQKAQVFAGIQLLEIKRSYGNLKRENVAWLKEPSALYIIGAVDLIGHEARCNMQSRKELAKLVLKSNLHLSTDIATKYLDAALYGTLGSDNALMVREGAKAAKYWLINNKTSKTTSLSTQLENFGIFA